MSQLPKMFNERRFRLLFLETQSVLLKKKESKKVRADINTAWKENYEAEKELLAHFACTYCQEKLVHRDECPYVQTANFEFAN